MLYQNKISGSNEHELKRDSTNDAVEVKRASETFITL
jgi:hypothetical protein